METALKAFGFFCMFFGGVSLGQVIKTKNWSWFGPMAIFIISGVIAFVVSRGV